MSEKRVHEIVRQFPENGLKQILSSPGNLRDLRQLAHRVASRHVGPGPVTPGDLPPSDRPASAGGTADSRAPTLMDAIRQQLRQGMTPRDVDPTYLD